MYEKILLVIAILLFTLIILFSLRNVFSPAKGLVISNILYFAALLFDYDVLALVSLGTIFTFFIFSLFFYIPMLIVSANPIISSNSIQATSHDRRVYYFSVLISIGIALSELVQIYSHFDINFIVLNAIEFRNSITGNVRDPNFFYEKSSLNSVFNASFLIALYANLLSHRYERRLKKYYLVSLISTSLLCIAEISRFHLLVLALFTFFSPFFWTGLKQWEGRRFFFRLGVIGFLFFIAVSVATGKAFGDIGFIEGALHRLNLVFYYFEQHFVPPDELTYGGASFYPWFLVVKDLGFDVEPWYMFNYAPSYYNSNWQGIQPFGMASYFIHDFGSFGGVLGSFLAGGILAVIWLISRVHRQFAYAIGLWFVVFFFMSFTVARTSQLEFWISLIMVIILACVRNIGFRARLNRVVEGD